MAGFDYRKGFESEKLKKQLKEHEEQKELIRKFEKMDRESAIAGKLIAVVVISAPFLLIGYCSGTL